jgi:hypothetical protein
MKKISIVILFAGLIITGFTTFNFITQEKIRYMSSVIQDRSHLLMWPPVIGGLLLLMGGGIYVDERIRNS